MLVEAAHGNLPLAAALLALLTAGTILFLPFALPILVDGVEAYPWKIARPLLLLVAAPLAGGLVIRSCAPAFAARTARVVGKIANASLLLLFVLLVAKNFRSLLGLPGSGAVAVTVLYTVGLFAAAWFAGGGVRGTRDVLGLATGARNFGAALVPADGIGGPKAVLMIVVAAIVTLVLSFLAVGRMRRRAEAIAV
jgi:BASS family bile acid:Na+ symporter